jgi:hypothetical protein
MTTQKSGTVAELRRGDVGAAEGLKNAEEALVRALESDDLHTDSALALEAVYTLVRNIAFGQSKKTVEENVSLLVERVSNPAPFMVEVSAQPASTQYEDILAQIEGELERRRSVYADIATAQEKVETELGTMQARLDSVTSILTLVQTENPHERKKLVSEQAGLRKTVGRITDARDGLRDLADYHLEKIGLLERHEDAVKLVQKGLPKGIIGEIFDLRSIGKEKPPGQ